MLEGEEKLVRLNLDTAKTTFADWYQHMQAGLTQKEGQEVTGLQDALVLPSPEKVTMYERQVAEIVSTMQTQLAEVVNAQYQEVNREVQWFVENVTQSSLSAATKTASEVTEAADEAVEKAEKAAKATKQ
jgi:phasin family protein